MAEMLGYWFEGDTLPHGDGRPVRVGETLTVEGPLVLCECGLHASARALDALDYATGTVVWRVELRGEIVHANDKACATECAHLWRLDATAALWAFARWCALTRSGDWNAPPVVVEFLTTGDESKRAVASAAAWDVAWDVAWAAKAAQNTQLERMLNEAREGRMAWRWRIVDGKSWRSQMPNPWTVAADAFRALADVADDLPPAEHATAMEDALRDIREARMEIAREAREEAPEAEG